MPHSSMDTSLRVRGGGGGAEGEGCEGEDVEGCEEGGGAEGRGCEGENEEEREGEGFEGGGWGGGMEVGWVWRVDGMTHCSRCCSRRSLRLWLQGACTHTYTDTGCACVDCTSMLARLQGGPARTHTHTHTHTEIVHVACISVFKWPRLEMACTLSHTHTLTHTHL